MKILFFGTPDFAAVSLAAVAAAGEDVVGVVTQPDRPKGRGYALVPSPVKAMAAELGLPVYTPERVRGEEFAALLASLDPDLILVVAYGRILPKNVLDYPRFGCVNAHASLLPRYRGAAPIQRAIMAGETETGVTAMYMDEGLDTGDMILTKKVSIADTDDFEAVHDKLAAAGAEALRDVISGIKSGSLTRTPQPEEGATYAAKIEDGDMRLDFSDGARPLSCRIRALSPIPAAYTTLPDGRRLRVYSASPADLSNDAAHGTVLSTSGGRILVACGDGAIFLDEVQPEGKRRMRAADFINGRGVAAGDVLGQR